MTKKRIQYIDIAKGLGIALVVFAHSKFPLNHFVTMFYLPMFFFISGCFFSSKSDTKEFLKKKTKQLYFKFVYIGLIILLLHSVFTKLGFYSEEIPNSLQSNYMKNIPDLNLCEYLSNLAQILALSVPEQLMRPLWFIGTLWIAMVILKLLDTYIFHRFKNKYLEPTMVAAVFFIGFFMKLPGFIGQGLVALLFCWIGSKCMCLGYLHKLFSMSKSKQLLIMLAGVVICAVGSLKTDLIFMANTYTSWWTMLVTSITGISSMLIICNWMSESVCGNILSYIGQHTIAILSMHMICFKIVNWLIIKVENLDDIYMAAYPIITNESLWWLAYSTVGIITPLAVQYFYNITKQYFIK